MTRNEAISTLSTSTYVGETLLAGLSMLAVIHNVGVAVTAVARVCMCVCVCVRVRERERERDLRPSLM